jgi:hypothetical protein
MADCEHEDLTWRAATPKREALNEAGWECLDCDADLGFRPDLDRSHTEIKTHCILMDFHESKLIYVSNGTMGEVIASNVAWRCRIENRYDQKSILRFILDDANMNPGSTFWQNRAERWLLGGEPIRDEQAAIPF